MKLLRSAILAGVITKVVKEARKPHNQRKLQEMLGKAKAKMNSGSRKP